jgi:hypothetical protein
MVFEQPGYDFLREPGGSNVIILVLSMLNRFSKLNKKNEL